MLAVLHILAALAGRRFVAAIRTQLCADGTMHTLRRRLVETLITGAAVLASAASLRAAPQDLSEWQPYRQADGLVNPAAAFAAQPATNAGESSDAIKVAQLPMEAVPSPMVMPDETLVSPMCDVDCTSMGSGQMWLVDPRDPSLWSWRLLPNGVVWQSYWAGAKESRISGTVFGDDGSSLLDVTLGGRAALLRYGTDGPGRPLGWELQLEGAGMPRLNLDHNWDLDAADFRFGLPLVYGREKWQAKFSYYHLSAHMGDEFAIREGALGQRINFSRDALVLGGAWFPHPAWRLYSEMGWAFHYDGGSEPWEFQFGVDVAEPGPTGIDGTPFVAINGHIREEHNFGGNVVAQAGWLWRGTNTSTLRTGFHYFNGKSNQFEFFDQFEQQIGGGIWYDF